MLESRLGQTLRQETATLDMHLTVILLNWNAAADTIRCIGEISGWKEIKPNIIVVDNASTNGDAQIIAQACPGIQLIASKVNLGFAGGNNLGIKAALETGNAPILLLNNDAFIAEKDVNKLLNTLQTHPDIGIIGPPLYDSEQKERLLSAGSKNPARHHHSHNHQFQSDSPVQIVECVPGTVIIFQSEVFNRIGLLDESYFFASEIADSCLRSAERGLLSAIDIRAKGFHRLSRSSRYRQTLYPYYIVRNRFLLIRKFHRKWKLFFYAFWGLYGLTLATKSYLSRKPAMAQAIKTGTLDGLIGRFGNQNERIMALTTGHLSQL